MMANLGATCTCACTGPSGISLHFLHCAEGEKMPHHGKLALAAALHSRPERRHLSSKRLNRPLPILHIAPCIILPSLLLLLLLLELLLLGRSHAKRAHSDTAIAARWLHPCELGEANSVARLGGCLDLVQAAVEGRQLSRQAGDRRRDVALHVGQRARHHLLLQLQRLQEVIAFIPSACFSMRTFTKPRFSTSTVACSRCCQYSGKQQHLRQALYSGNAQSPDEHCVHAYLLTGKCATIVGQERHSTGMSVNPKRQWLGNASPTLISATSRS